MCRSQGWRIAGTSSVWRERGLLCNNRRRPPKLTQTAARSLLLLLLLTIYREWCHLPATSATQHHCSRACKLQSASRLLYDVPWIHTANWRMQFLQTANYTANSEHYMFTLYLTARRWMKCDRCTKFYFFWKQTKCRVLFCPSHRPIENFTQW